MSDRVELDGGRVVLINADCLEVLPTLEPGSVDAVVTDPPWELSGNAIEIRGTGVAPCRQQSLTLTKGAVGEWSAEAIRLCQVVCHGDCFFFAGYKEVADLIKACCRYRGLFVWHKPNGPPAAFYPAKMDTSFIVWSAIKSALYGHQHWPSMVFSVPFPQAGCFAAERLVDETGKAVHPCQGPVALYEDLLKPLPASCTVMDPYLGTGTCGVAAARLSHQFLGVERNPEYFAIAKGRIEEELRLRDGRGPLLETGRLL